MMLALSLLLAQSPSPAFPAEAIWIGVVVVVLMALAAALNHVTATVERFKTKPEAHKVYASKEDVTALESRMRSEVTAADARSEARARENRDLIQEKVSGLERVLIEKITDNKTNHTEQFGFLRGELHAVRGSMQTLATEVSRAVGRLEGSEKALLRARDE